MNVLLIDDEARALNLLRNLLEQNCPRIDKIYTASSLLEGVDKIKEFSPSIVFLDIEMPQHSGLEIFDFFPQQEISFEIIFTTAYNEFALQAFELSAVDYLLKPLRASQLKKAVNKCIALMGDSQIDEKLTELKESLSLSEFRKIALPVSDGIKFVKLKEIILFSGEGMYTKIYSENEGELLISKPLKYFAELLNPISYFYKPHRSHLVNLRFIKKYVKSGGGYIILDNCMRVSVAREKKEEFLEIVSNL